MAAKNFLECNLSGAMYKNFIGFDFSVSSSDNIWSISVALIVELINFALIQSSLKASTWSFMRDIKGEITRVIHSKTTPGS